MTVSYSLFNLEYNELNLKSVSVLDDNMYYDDQDATGSNEPWRNRH